MDKTSKNSGNTAAPPREAATFAERLSWLLKEKGITNKELATHLSITQQAVNLYASGSSFPALDKLKKIAEYFGVSCDFLLGRARAAAPDDFIQAAVKRYGLSEGALAFLERLNAPLGIDSAECERVAAKQKAFEASIETAPGRVGSPPPLEPGEWQELLAIMQNETNKHALNMLNDMLTAKTGREWETYGFQILTSIYSYCCGVYEDMQRQRRGKTGITYYTLTADTQRNSELCALNGILAKLRDKLRGANINAT